MKLIFRKICEKYKIILHEVKIGDKYCIANGNDNYINHSCCAGKTEIWLGIYENEELKTLSFFHELSHCLDPIDWSVNANEFTAYSQEKFIWYVTYVLAERYNIYFSIGAKKWAEKQLETYYPN